jgi:isopentenyl-diphosphate Delta-isomerase
MPKPQVVLVTPEDEIIGQADLLSAHRGNGQLHRAVSILIFTHDHKLLLQQRSSHKPLWPLFWSNTCCTHLQPNQTNLDCAKQRLEEEMGISTNLNYKYTFEYQARYNQQLSEHELDAVFFGRTDQKPNLDPKEAADFKYLSYPELVADIKLKPDQYTPWLKLILKKIPSF